MRVAGLIPARAGSRRLPNKNWETLGLAGAPLWKLAVQQAAKSGVINPIVVSTDDATILNLAYGPDFDTLQRPVALATDDAPMFRVVEHADRIMSGAWGIKYDAICVLQPTSPLRTPEDIAAAVGMMGEGIESVVSVCDGPDDIAFSVRHAQRLERLPSIVVPNGAIFILSVEALRAGRDWYGPYSYAYKMPKERSVDIDTAVDLELARLLAVKG